MTGPARSLQFDDVFEVIGDRGLRVAQRRYLDRGALPVVDQGEGLVGGYCDDPALAYNGTLPVLIFGDHTRRVKFVDFPFVVGADGTKILRPRDCMDYRFGYYQLLATELRDRGYARHMSELRKATFWCPPLEEQRAIVEILEDHLSRLDAATASLRSAQAMKRRFVDSLLGSVFNGASKSAPLGEIVEEVIDHRGKTPTKLGGEFTSDGVRVISAIHIKGGRIKFDERDRFVSEEMYLRWMAVPLRRGDVLLTSEAPLGSTALVETDEPLVLSQRLFALRAADEVILPELLRYFLDSPIGQGQLTQRSSGTTVTGIRQSELLNIRVPLLDRSAQRRLVQHLVEVLSRVEYTSHVLAEQTRRAEQLRRSLLAAAFRGDLTREWRERHG